MQVACLSPTPSHLNAALLTTDRGDFDTEPSCAFLSPASGLKSTLSALKKVTLSSPLVPGVK